MLWRGEVQQRFAVDRLKDRDFASRYYDELESELQGVQAQPLSLDEKCKKLEETIQRVATNTIGYTRKQANKKWFDEECAKVNKKRTPSESEPSKSKPEEPKILTN
jgi:tRNA A37 N6-isopentenylltransferase MiaA